MAKAKTAKSGFRILDGDFTEAYLYAESLLERKDVSKETASETLLVIEALLQKLVDWGLDEDTDVEISGRGRLGDYRISIGFEGKVFSPEDVPSPIEDKILSAHNDKISYSYFSGYNEVCVTVTRSNRTSTFVCVVASLLGVAVYIALSSQLSVAEQKDLLENYVFPLEKLYANAMLMVGAPMTFFSLLKNLTDTYVVSRSGSGVRALQLRTIATSAFAILLAFIAFAILSVALSGFEGTASEFRGSFDRTFADVVTSLMPPSIFEPFENISPIPIIVLALLFTYAMCSAGKYFDALRQAMMACYTLFSRILHVLIAVLPVFCFLAMLDVFIDGGMGSAIEIPLYFVAFNLGFLLLFATYAIRLRARGIKVIPFVRKLVPLLRENGKIGSAIDAASYNIRYCLKVFKIDRTLLERNVPVLAETNLDGNCFILMFFTFVFAYMTDTKLSWISLVVLAALVLFLSLGAPNQPGSILIGSLIITMYLNSFEMVSMAIIAEMLLGGAQNLINVIGDIVMVAIDDRKLKERMTTDAAR